MNERLTGAMIRRARLEKNWSQEGLCRDICAVSYLSRLEQGKVEAASEVVRLLFERLGMAWNTDEAFLNEASAHAEACYEAIFSGDASRMKALGLEFEEKEKAMTESPLGSDAA